MQLLGFLIFCVVLFVALAWLYEFVKEVLVPGILSTLVSIIDSIKHGVKDLVTHLRYGYKDSVPERTQSQPERESTHPSVQYELEKDEYENENKEKCFDIDKLEEYFKRPFLLNEFCEKSPRGISRVKIDSRNGNFELRRKDIGSVLSKSEIKEINERSESETVNVEMSKESEFYISNFEEFDSSDSLDIKYAIEALGKGVVISSDSIGVDSDIVDMLDIHPEDSSYEGLNIYFLEESRKSELPKGEVLWSYERNDFFKAEIEKREINIEKRVRQLRMEEIDEKLSSTKNKVRKAEPRFESLRFYEKNSRTVRIQEKGKGVSKPTFSMDLHGYKKEGGTKALNIFLDIMEDEKVELFSVIHGKTDGVMKEITKKYLSQRNFYHNTREGETYVFCDHERYEKEDKKKRVDRFSRQVEIPKTQRYIILNISVYNGNSNKVEPNEDFSFLSVRSENMNGFDTNKVSF